MSDIQRKWYVLRAIGGKEKKVKEYIEGEIASAEMSRGLPNWGFQKKSERIEFKTHVADLPAAEEASLIWKTAEELNWSPEKVADLLERVAVGDPDYDPTESGLSFIQDFLHRSELANQPVTTETLQIANQQVKSNPNHFKCDGRIHCSQMNSKDEADWFAQNCPGTRMDGDGDGDACESDSRW